MSAVDTWMQLQHNCAQGAAPIETFEHEQQRRCLTQLLASPSALYTHAAAFGISPAAFRLKCWKVRVMQSSRLSLFCFVYKGCSCLIFCCQLAVYYQQELATVQGIILPVAPKSEQKEPPSVATNV